MAAARFVARSVIRRRPLTRLGLVLLIGIAGGALIATAAGARRTERAFPQLVDRSDVSDVVVVSDTPIDLEAARAVDGVVSARTALGLGLAADGPEGIPDFEANPGATASLVANLIGAWPMWAGRRTRPATALRAE